MTHNQVVYDGPFEKSLPTDLLYCMKRIFSISLTTNHEWVNPHTLTIAAFRQQETLHIHPIQFILQVGRGMLGES